MLKYFSVILIVLCMFFLSCQSQGEDNQDEETQENDISDIPEDTGSPNIESADQELLSSSAHEEIFEGEWKSQEIGTITLFNTSPGSYTGIYSNKNENIYGVIENGILSDETLTFDFSQTGIETETIFGRGQFTAEGDQLSGTLTSENGNEIAVNADKSN